MDWQGLTTFAHEVGPCIIMAIALIVMELALHGWTNKEIKRLQDLLQKKGE